MTKEQFLDILERNPFDLLFFNKTEAYKVGSYSKEAKIIELQAIYAYNTPQLNETNCHEFFIERELSGESKLVIYIVNTEINRLKDTLRNL